MYAISLTSIPPRFAKLGPVLENLLAQDPAPDQVVLCLSRLYRRFPGAVDAPDVPKGVSVIWSDDDLGPATKALPPARAIAGKYDHLIYCDDDWLVPKNWASCLLSARHPGEAVTGAGYHVSRLGRASQNTGNIVDIAQGFSGVLVDPVWLTGRDLDPPEAAWAVDDIWLSGHLARQGIRIRVAPISRAGQRLAFEDTHGLQDSLIAGRNRDAANRACAALLHERFGIWPPLD